MCTLYTGQWVVFIRSVQCVLYILDSGLCSLEVYNVYFIYWTVGCVHWKCTMCTLYTGQWVVFIGSVQCVHYILDSGLCSLEVYNVYFIYWTVGCVHWKCTMCNSEWIVFIE